MKNPELQKRMEAWCIQSPEAPGFHAIITPDKCECQETQMYRLNLLKGDSYKLESKELEMQAALIEGSVTISEHPVLSREMKLYDAAYIPGNDSMVFTANEDSVIYIAAAKYEGYGRPLYREFDANGPVGEIHQVHGSGISQRNIYMTLGQEDEASRLICGYTFGGAGTWTSWPPHQHEKDLEEIYCYFNMPLPHFGFHVSYIEPNDIENIVTHTVHTGTFVQIPVGHHPTVASPGTRNVYWFVMGALRHSSRRFDLLIPDPALKDFNS